MSQAMQHQVLLYFEYLSNDPIRLAAYIFVTLCVIAAAKLVFLVIVEDVDHLLGGDQP